MEEKKENTGLKVLGVIGKTIVVFFALIGVIATVFVMSLAKYTPEIKEIMFTYNIVSQYFYEPVDKKDILGGVPSGLVYGLDDPYSQYFSPEEYASFANQVAGTYGGVGVSLGQDDASGYVKVVKVHPGTPAEKAGILEGDLILKAGDLDGAGRQADEVSGVLRGDPDTEVMLTVFRTSQNKEIDISVTREILNTPSVYGGFLKSEPDTLYIQISSFVSNTTTELETLLNGLDKTPKNIILDLRSNGGGLVDQAIKVASYFVPEGVVMYESGRDESLLEPYRVSGANFLDVPITVLVDENTASSSEILAGAIQDRGTGILIGETTYGKAVVQSVIPTPAGGGIRLTTKRYLTPDQRDINGTGLVPDIELIMTADDYLKIDRNNFPDENNDLLIKRALTSFNE